MKSSDEMFQNILNRRKAYLEKKKQRITIIRRTISLCACFTVIFSGYRIWSNIPKIPIQPPIVDESSESTSEDISDVNTSSPESTENVPQSSDFVSNTTSDEKTEPDDSNPDATNSNTQSDTVTTQHSTETVISTEQTQPIETQLSIITTVPIHTETPLNTTQTKPIQTTQTKPETQKTTAITTLPVIQTQPIQTTAPSQVTDEPLTTIPMETKPISDDNCRFLYPVGQNMKIDRYKTMAEASYMVYNETETTVTTESPVTTQTTTTTVPVEDIGSIPNYYGFSVTPSEVTLSVGESCKLNVNFALPVYYEESVVYHSSKGNIAGVSADGVVTANSEGKTVISVSAKFDPEKVGLDENANIVRTISIPVTVTPDKSITPEQQAKLSELKKKGDLLTGEFTRAEKEILGEIRQDDVRISHKVLDSILSNSNSFQDIYESLKSTVKYPDFYGGSGVTKIEYWFDEKGEEKILLILEQECVFYFHYEERDIIND